MIWVGPRAGVAARGWQRANQGVPQPALLSSQSLLAVHYSLPMQISSFIRHPSSFVPRLEQGCPVLARLDRPIDHPARSALEALPPDRGIGAPMRNHPVHTPSTQIRKFNKCPSEQQTTGTSRTILTYCPIAIYAPPPCRRPVAAPPLYPRRGQRREAIFDPKRGHFALALIARAHPKDRPSAKLLPAQRMAPHRARFRRRKQDIAAWPSASRDEQRQATTGGRGLLGWSPAIMFSRSGSKRAAGEDRLGHDKCGTAGRRS
jgi:hypothetical protein